MYRFAVFGPAEVTKTKHLWSYCKSDLYVWSILELAFFSPIQKWVLLIFGLEVPCRHHCQGEEYPWKLPAILEGQVAQLAQSPTALYTLWKVDVYLNQLQSPQLPHLCNAFIIWGSRKFFLQFPPGIFILGQFTLPIRDRKRRGECEYVGQDSREDLTTFRCLQSQQFKMPVAFSTSRPHISPHIQFLNNYQNLEP